MFHYWIVSEQIIWIFVNLKSIIDIVLDKKNIAPVTHEPLVLHRVSLYALDISYFITYEQ